MEKIKEMFRKEDGQEVGICMTIFDERSLNSYKFARADLISKGFEQIEYPH